MEITIERTWRDLRQSRQHLFREMSAHALGNWMAVLAILVIAGAAVFAETSVFRAPGVLRVETGGLVTKTVFFAGGILAAYLCLSLWRSQRVMGRVMDGDTLVFCRLSHDGLTFGVTDVWSKFVSWQLISKVQFRGRAISFEIWPHQTLDIPKVVFTRDQIESIIAFLADTREVVPPDAFFGWRRKRRLGREVYGAMIRQPLAAAK